MGKSEEPFDPYFKWLGIRPKDQPPHYYRLLGIEIFEDDADVIANAADMQMAHLRKFQSGKHSQESQRLLNEVALAKICLLNPEKKAAYNAELREKARPPLGAPPRVAGRMPVEPPPVEPPPIEPEPVAGFPFVVSPPTAGPPHIGPPPGFVEPESAAPPFAVPAEPFAPPFARPAEPFAPPFAEPAEPFAPPFVRPAAPFVPPLAKPAAPFAPPFVPPSPLTAAPPIDVSPPQPSKRSGPLSGIGKRGEVAPVRVQPPVAAPLPEPFVPIAEAAAPVESEEPVRVVVPDAADVRISRAVERIAHSWRPDWSELGGLAALVCVAVVTFFAPRVIPPAIANHKWTLFGYWLLALVGSIAALGSAWRHFVSMEAAARGSAEMLAIADHVRSGARAYLRQYCKTAGPYFGALAAAVLILAFVFRARGPWAVGPNLQNAWVAPGLLTGAFFSGLAGWFGMQAAIRASSRAAAGVHESLGRGMGITLGFGAVTGMAVVGLGLLDISFWFVLLYWFVPLASDRPLSLPQIVAAMLCFGVGASSQALFARVGGGILARAAELGAESAEEGDAAVPRHHKRNPAAVARSVGNVIGMGADLYGSYCTAILAAAVLGVSAASAGALTPQGMAPPQFQLRACLLPMVLAAMGIIASIFGLRAICPAEGASPRALLRAVGCGVNRATFLMIVAAFVFTRLVMPDFLGLALSATAGLLAGWLIGKWGERIASGQSKLGQDTAERALVGPAAVVLGGMADGMKGVAFPAIAVSVAALAAFGAGVHGHFDDGRWFPMGLYGIAMAAVGMLSTLGLTLAVDAYDPIADNTRRHAAMAGASHKLREQIAVLEGLGATLAMRSKTFVIASTALAGVALLAAYAQVAGGAGNILHPRVVVGVLVGVMATFLFTAMIFGAVEKSAQAMARAVRRERRENPGAFQGSETLDYPSFVAQRTRSLYRHLTRPALVALVAPLAVGILLGPAGVAGLLLGAVVGGLSMATFLVSAGQSWTLAKEYIQRIAGEGDFGHDPSRQIALGDPSNEITGRSLTAFLFVMATFSLLIAGLVLRWNLPATKFF
jgi:K(+)-stimulated pyrophosphate-energized sodium pump